MIKEYVYPKEALPEIKFECPELLKKSCGNCGNTCITNKNAIRPGLMCNKLRELYKAKSIENGNPSVNYLKNYSVCKLWTPQQCQ